MPECVRTISPVDGQVVVERQFQSLDDAQKAVRTAADVQKRWRSTPVEERITRVGRMIDLMVANRETLAREITMQMGRPISQAAGEIDGMASRARHMMAIAPSSLADIVQPAEGASKRFIRREPWGVVFAITPWNFPYLTAVNVVVPALLAGNAVILKPSPQTPLIGERFAEAAREAGLPVGLLQYLHLDTDTTLALVREGEIQYTSFTGSVAVGRQVEKAAAGRFMSVGLELGGKDPAYVREDAQLDEAVAGLVDGAFFNSGQSCCGIERIYVHQSLYDDFIGRFASLVGQYVLGDPLAPETNLGPVVSAASKARIEAEIAAAVSAGATRLIDEEAFQTKDLGPAYMNPQVLVNVHQNMSIMQQETFGPVVGIMPVADDAEAIRLMNDSIYGLTASIWSRDSDAALKIANDIEAGTVFMNRCDALDPALAWTGIKQSGRGCTLSAFGFDALTRPKSFNFKQSA